MDDHADGQHQRDTRLQRHTRCHHLDAWQRLLAKPADRAGLVFFRIAFGLAVAWEASRIVTEGWVAENLSGKVFYFKYWPFEFVRPLTPVGWYIFLAVLGLAGLWLATGYQRRVAAVVTTLGLTYVFLVEQATYLNHFYLICLLSALLIVVADDKLWGYALLRFQVGVPYFFGGIAKLNADWLAGEPLRQWLTERVDHGVVPSGFATEPVVYFMTWGALLFDLGVVFALMNRRTRLFAYVVALGFHLMNARLFSIGVFPWTMILVTTVFFEPDWPRRFVRAVRERDLRRLAPTGLAFLVGSVLAVVLPLDFELPRILIGGLGCAVAAFHWDEPFTAGPAPSGDTGHTGLRRPVLAFLVGWVVVQVTVPMRHVVIPGNVHWTEEGHNFSWHMKLRDKECAGVMVVVDPSSGQQYFVKPEEYLTARQRRKMLSRPHMIIEFAHWLDAQERPADVEVRARILCSLNGRVGRPLVDPNLDLSEEPYPWWGHARWIRPNSVRINKS